MVVPFSRWLTVGCVTLAGCVGGDLAVDTSDIRVYQSWPQCEYTSLGPVEGKDGMKPSQTQAGATRTGRWAPQGTDERALRRLRLAAREKGGDAVIIVLRDRKQPPGWTGPQAKSSIKRAPIQIVYKGIAIIDCD